LVVLVVAGTVMVVVRPELPAEVPDSWFLTATALIVVVTARLAARQVELHRMAGSTSTSSRPVRSSSWLAPRSPASVPTLRRRGGGPPMS
jgi:hypothetical protein